MLNIVNDLLGLLLRYKVIIFNLFGWDLINANLSGAYLTSVHLREIKLTGANLSNVNLSAAHLSNVDLSGVKLDGATLQSARIFKSNLSNVNFSKTNVFNSNFEYSTLNDASFVGCELFGANFSGSDLSNVDLSGAILYRTNFTAANLDNTNFSNSNLGETIFGLTNLGMAMNLEEVKVDAPCSIDFQTIRASLKIPKTFLIKIGLPELYVDYLPDFYQNEGIRFFPVFLSHSWEDKGFAHKIYEALIAKGVNVFFDEKKLKPGDLIYKSLNKAIDQYDKMILVCSKSSLESWWVSLELDYMLKKRTKHKLLNENFEPLIPITIDDFVYQWSDARADEVRRYVIGDFKDWHDAVAFEKALGNLIHALNIDRPDVKPPSFIKTS